MASVSSASLRTPVNECIVRSDFPTKKNLAGNSQMSEAVLTKKLRELLSLASCSSEKTSFQPKPRTLSLKSFLR